MSYGPNVNHVISGETNAKLIALTIRLERLHRTLYERCVYDSHTQEQIVNAQQIVKEINSLLKIGE